MDNIIKYSNLCKRKEYKFFYISDLHLDRNSSSNYIVPTPEIVFFQVQKMIESCIYDEEKEIPCLFLLGDIAEDFHTVVIFLSILKKLFKGEIIYTLGNHELYAFNRNYHILEQIKALSLQGIKIGREWGINRKTGLLEFFNERKDYSCVIMARTGASPNQLKWSSTNIEYCEQKRAEYYTKLYKRMSDYAITNQIPLIVASHYPIEQWYGFREGINWINIRPESNNFIYYLSGHTHWNKLDLENRYYADNQVGCGYNNLEIYLKVLYLQIPKHPFYSYKDGIYAIDKNDYWNFMIWNGITMNKPKIEATYYMIKREPYYLFMRKTKKSLCILHGGASRVAEHSLEYYYKHLLEQGDYQTTILKQGYYDRMVHISEWVQSWGGSGKIHGAIVDIDYYNHLFINPLDGTIMPYYAPDIESGKILRYAYSSTAKLLTAKKKELLECFNEKQKMELALITSYSIIPYENYLVDEELNTQMEYKVNREFAHKINRAIETNIISFWWDEIFKPKGKEQKEIEDKQ